jgi:hypothetical protein
MLFHSIILARRTVAGQRIRGRQAQECQTVDKMALLDVTPEHT